MFFSQEEAKKMSKIPNMSQEEAYDGQDVKRYPEFSRCTKMPKMLQMTQRYQYNNSRRVPSQFHLRPYSACNVLEQIKLGPIIVPYSYPH